jgi:hypothetical protein
VVVLSATVSTTLQEDSDAVHFHLPLTEPDGDVLDLSDADTLVAVVSAPDRTKSTRSLTVVDADGGVAAYAPPSGFFTTPGRWKIQAKIGWGDGSFYFSPVFKVKVKANL